MDAIVMRVAGSEDLETVQSILLEAARWLEERGMPLWRDDELSIECIKAAVLAGEFVLAEREGDALGTLKYQLEDRPFWPDVPAGESAFLHRVAVRRRAAGGRVSRAMLEWAVEETKRRGRRYLRLDCESERAKVRGVYERFGFRHHSDRQVGPYHVSRYEYDVTGAKNQVAISP